MAETAIGAPHIFCNQTKLFVSTKKGVMELSPIIHTTSPYGEGYDWKTQGVFQTCKSVAYFLLSEELLMLICKKGKTGAVLPLLTLSKDSNPTSFDWKIRLNGKDVKKFVEKTNKDFDKYVTQVLTK